MSTKQNSPNISSIVMPNIAVLIMFCLKVILRVGPISLVVVRCLNLGHKVANILSVHDLTNVASIPLATVGASKRGCHPIFI